MTHAAKILADSISPDGVRLTTFEVTFPRIVLAEFNTHRMLSRNSASSRAIPIEKMMRMVHENPYIPTHWGKNQKGMQAEEEIGSDHIAVCVREWLRARDAAVESAYRLSGISGGTVGVHKQITNRLLEPFMWHTVICTATEYSNFFHLRCHKDAHPEIRKVAELMRELYESGKPKELDYGQWHLPLLQVDDWDYVSQEERRKLANQKEVDEFLCKVSVGRCARTSYLTHHGKRDLLEDVGLHDRCLSNGHLSPFEHVARPITKDDWFLGSPEKSFCGNFRGWLSYRKMIPGEEDILGKSNG